MLTPPPKPGGATDSGLVALPRPLVIHGPFGVEQGTGCRAALGGGGRLHPPRGGRGGGPQLTGSRRRCLGGSVVGPVAEGPLLVLKVRKKKSTRYVGRGGGGGCQPTAPEKRWQQMLGGARYIRIRHCIEEVAAGTVILGDARNVLTTGDGGRER